MSYCRFSSDDWSCDVYCYEDINGGYTTHVATSKAVGVPKNLHCPATDFDAFIKSHQEQLQFLETAERRDIGLPFDGQSFNDRDLEGFLETLTMLKKSGYNVPDYVIETVKEEIANEYKQEQS